MSSTGKKSPATKRTRKRKCSAVNKTIGKKEKIPEIIFDTPVKQPKSILKKTNVKNPQKKSITFWDDPQLVHHDRCWIEDENVVPELSDEGHNILKGEQWMWREKEDSTFEEQEGRAVYSLDKMPSDYWFKSIVEVEQEKPFDFFKEEIRFECFDVESSENSSVTNTEEVKTSDLNHGLDYNPYFKINPYFKLGATDFNENPGRNDPECIALVLKEEEAVDIPGSSIDEFQSDVLKDITKAPHFEKAQVEEVVEQEDAVDTPDSSIDGFYSEVLKDITKAQVEEVVEQEDAVDTPDSSIDGFYSDVLKGITKASRFEKAQVEEVVEQEEAVDTPGSSIDEFQSDVLKDITKAPHFEKAQVEEVVEQEEAVDTPDSSIDGFHSDALKGIIKASRFEKAQVEEVVEQEEAVDTPDSSIDGFQGDVLKGITKASRFEKAQVKEDVRQSETMSHSTVSNQITTLENQIPKKVLSNNEKICILRKKTGNRSVSPNWKNMKVALINDGEKNENIALKDRTFSLESNAKCYENSSSSREEICIQRKRTKNTSLKSNVKNKKMSFANNEEKHDNIVSKNGASSLVSNDKCIENVLLTQEEMYRKVKNDYFKPHMKSKNMFPATQKEKNENISEKTEKSSMESNDKCFINVHNGQETRSMEQYHSETDQSLKKAKAECSLNSELTQILLFKFKDWLTELMLDDVSSGEENNEKDLEKWLKKNNFFN